MLVSFAGMHSANAKGPVKATILAGQSNMGGQKLPDSEPAKPVSRTVRNIEGWTVQVDDRLLAPTNDAIGARALRFLQSRLADIKAVMATEPLKKLQAVTIVLDLSHGKLRTMQYHPSAGWLQENGYSTDLAKCVHIPVAADLATPRNINQQPWVVLHELAHAYHDQVLGFEEPRILKAYEDFKRSGHGEGTLLYDGTRTRHYALTDHKEFFAEMTEAYFGLNDFFPFNRAERVYPGHFTINADGGGYGGDTTWPGLDSWQMVGPYLQLGRTRLVLDYFDFVPHACGVLQEDLNSY
jgi:hypothetical protein